MSGANTNSPLMEQDPPVAKSQAAMWKEKILGNSKYIAAFLIVAVIVLVILNKDKVCGLVGLEISVGKSKSKSKKDECKTEWDIDKELALLEAKQATLLRSV